VRFPYCSVASHRRSRGDHGIHPAVDRQFDSGFSQVEAPHETRQGRHSAIGRKRIQRICSAPSANFNEEGIADPVGKQNRSISRKRQTATCSMPRPHYGHIFQQRETAAHCEGPFSALLRGFSWYARQDSNLWPLAPEASALSAELRARTFAGLLTLTPIHKMGRPPYTLRQRVYRIRPEKSASALQRRGTGEQPS
jgi:hypothetical protein